jgi:hypothetical protein
MKAYGEVKVQLQSFLSCILGGVVISTPWLLYLHGKNSWYPSSGILSVLQSWSLPVLQMELQSFRLPVHSLLAILTFLV